jgi:hypothetical protein
VSTLTLRGETIALESGIFWFDHQWGMLEAAPRSAALRAAGNLQPPDLIGWDWFEAQFDGNRQITCSAPHLDTLRAFYFQTGPTPPGTMHAAVEGKFVAADGTATSVTGALDVTEWVKSEASPAPHDYPPTHTRYPNRWQFQFGDDVDADIRAFTMEPIVAGGQSGFFAGGAQYAEGAVVLLDAAGNDVGRGFAESVSYADTLANQLRLAGLPDSDEFKRLFGEVAPSEGLQNASAAFVALNADEVQRIAATCLGV